ncbi:ribosome hibernation-promoting factor, HPF/YfiA family [Kocuria palustris]|uniref:ribosome hibernation-promoting factor, HPF/YfiA family n=1 Tax=Kocuria palustris TaxID=71999 RepID=UPI00119FCF7A|nr:ribosome-associated translation inhibitor RaiA [Kocuria palustris]
MELTIQGRSVTISDRFREYVEGRVVRFEELGDKVQRIEIKVLKENPHPGHDGMRVEATVIGRGPVVRAEARGDDKQAAFDAAYAKLIEQLRRARDRRKIHRGNHRPTAVHEATADLPVAPVGEQPYATPEELSAAEEEAFDTEYPLSEDVPPVEIRRKSFPAERMSADQAIDRMELVGHDFFLYLDSETDEASVAYRRKGWEYGVISLSEAVAEPETTESRAYQTS